MFKPTKAENDPQTWMNLLDELFSKQISPIINFLFVAARMGKPNRWNLNWKKVLRELELET